MRNDGRGDQIGAMFGHDGALADGAHLVPGAADALQRRRDRGRRLDLDDQVDGSHVDSEFQAAGGHHCGQAAGLQVVLNQRPLLLADGPVVGPGQELLRGGGGWRTRGIGVESCDVVETSSQPFGEAT